MRRNPLLLLLLLLVTCPLAGAAAALDPVAENLSAARSEQAAAEAHLRRLEAVAAKANDAAARLAAQRAAAAAAIDAAEARITAAELELHARAQRLAAYRRSMAETERPVFALLAGMAMMGERPPILALADRGGVEQLVRTRILLDATVPVIKTRSAALAAKVRAGQLLEADAAQARAALIAGRALLTRREKGFATLEEQATKAANAAGGRALEAGDQVLAGRDSLESANLAGSESARRMAAELLGDDPLPLAPGGGSAAVQAPFAYTLPAEAAVSRGLAEVDRGGVRSRGITLATARGAALIIPADGIVRFAGPFEDYDGIVVIDHGQGWLSLIVNLATPLAPGQRVTRGQTLGRALGPVEVELSRNGRRFSPAIIAGSSNGLFKGR